jgi:phosphate-selective porin OprO/OprP
MKTQSILQRTLQALLITGISIFALAPAIAGDKPTEENADILPVSGTVLIRNVTLIDQLGKQKDIIINILIRDKKLVLVTQEDIPVDSAELALDAEKGYLLGKIKLGEPPSFMILDSDPRENFDALLDTSRHSRFAVQKGEIRLNRLNLASETNEKPKRSGWLAYSPPPLTLSTSYDDTAKWNRWDTKYISGLFFGALVLDRQYWVSQDDTSRSQVGELDDFEGGEVRALRVGLVGTLNFPQPWVYYVSASTNAYNRGLETSTDDSLQFIDWRIDIPAGKEMTLSIGKQKEPISMSRLMGLVYLPMQERPAVLDTLLRSRNIGALFSGVSFGRRMTWAGGVFNDWLESGDTFNENTTSFSGRLTWLPLISQDESNLLHLGFGLRYANTKESVRSAQKSEFRRSPIFVDTGRFDADSTLTYDLEASWRKGPFWLASEFVLTDVDSPATGSPSFFGYSVTASWALTGEMRRYNHRSGVFRPLSVAKSVYQGGLGTWEVAARWSVLDLNDKLITGGEMRTFSLGLNWWLNQIFSVSVNYRLITLDRFGVEGDSSGVNARVVLLLE